MRERWGLRAPRWLLDGEALDFLDLNQYASFDVASKTGQVYTLWIRLGDYDTVEVRLTTGEGDIP